MKKKIIPNLNDEQAQIVIQDFENEKCTTTKTKQPDDLWTVEVLCPEKRAR